MPTLASKDVPIANQVEQPQMDPPHRQDAEHSTTEVEVRTEVVEHEDVLFHLPDDAPSRAGALVWVFVHALGKVNNVDGTAGFEQQSRSWIDEWQLGKTIVEALRDLGLDEASAAQSLALIKVMTSHQRWYADPSVAGNHPRALLESLLVDPDVQQVLRTNRYRDVLWFNKESYEQLLDRLMLLAHLGRGASPAARAALQDDHRLIERLRKAEAGSDYQVEKLLSLAAQSPA